MKAIALILSLCFSLNVLAAHGTVQELEKAFDSYSYAVTVEWDQKDQEVYAEATAKLFKELDQLLQSGAVTKEDIIAFAQKKMGSKQNFDSVQAQLNLAVNKNMTTEEVMRVLQDQTSSFYDRGASWSGDVWTITGIVVGVAFITYLIIAASQEATETCVESVPVQQCGWYSPATNVPAQWQCYYNYVCTRWEPIQK